MNEHAVDKDVVLGDFWERAASPGFVEVPAGHRQAQLVRDTAGAAAASPLGADDDQSRAMCAELLFERLDHVALMVVSAQAAQWYTVLLCAPGHDGKRRASEPRPEAKGRDASAI